jgi:hypothetical protein
MGIAYNTSVIRDGLVLYLDAANLKSYPGTGAVWKDVSGNLNNCTLLNSPTYFTDNEGYLEFDGVNQYGQISDFGYPSENPTDPFTIEAMVYIPTGLDWKVDGSGTAIIGRGSYMGSHGLIRSSEGNIQFWIRTKTAVDNNISASTYSATASGLQRNTWYHIVGVNHSSELMQIYVNGELMQSVDMTGASQEFIDSGVWRIAGNIAFGGNNGLYGNGRYPMFKIYSKALNQEEIKTNFEALRGRYGI